MEQLLSLKYWLKGGLSNKAGQGMQAGTAGAAHEFLQTQHGLQPGQVYPSTGHLAPGSSSPASPGISFIFRNSSLCIEKLGDSETHLYSFP